MWFLNIIKHYTKSIQWGDIPVLEFNISDSQMLTLHIFNNLSLFTSE